jgi:hypothetical protein
MKKVYVALGCFFALLLATANPSFSADVKIKTFTVSAELQGSSVAVTCKIEPLSEEPIKKLHFEARRAGDEQIADVAIAANGAPVAVEVTKKEHEWAGKSVYFYLIDKELPTPLKEGETLTLSYVVNNVQTPGYLQVPLFVPSWKLVQEGIAFNGSIKLPSGSYYQGRSFPISYGVEESGEKETILYRNLNLPAGLYASVGSEKAGFFTWSKNWTIFMFLLIIVITFLYLRYEIRQRKGGTGR